MSHVEQFEHNPGDHDDPKGDSTWVIGIGGVIILIVLIFAITVLYYRTDAEMVEARIINETPVEVTKLRKEQDERLFAPPGLTPVLDADGNPVKDSSGKPVTKIHVPISIAIDRMVAESASVGGGTTKQP